MYFWIDLNLKSCSCANRGLTNIETAIKTFHRQTGSVFRGNTRPTSESGASRSSLFGFHFPFPSAGVLKKPSRLPNPWPSPPPIAMASSSAGAFTVLPLLRLSLARKPLLGSPLYICHSCLRPHSSLPFLPMWHASARHGHCYAGAFVRNPHRAPAYSSLHLT
jgi:hypothetical protein